MSVVSSSSKVQPFYCQDGAMPVCPRCGGKHVGLEERKFTEPIKLDGRDWDMWSTCPTTGEVIIIHTPPSRPGPALWDCMARAVEIYLKQIMREEDESVTRQIFTLIAPDVTSVRGYW